MTSIPRFSAANKAMYLILESSSLRLTLPKTGNFKRYASHHAFLRLHIADDDNLFSQCNG